MVRLFVEKIAGIYACCDALITAQDIASASRFQNQSRRMEHLAWRRIVRRELGRGVSIDYNDVGAPVVDTPATSISVAHSREVVAVAIAEGRVGVDVESTERSFERAQSRYMSEGESALSSDALWPCMVWCAKEAIYKCYGRRGVDLRDIALTEYDAEHNIIYGIVCQKFCVEVKISHHGKYVVALAVER